MTANNTIYVSKFWGVISHNPDQCLDCDYSQEMELISPIEAVRLLSETDTQFNWVYFNYTDLPREEGSND